MKYLWILFLSLSFSKLYSQDNEIGLSHYLFPEFTQGIVLMKGGKENKALLNYNSSTEEMVFINNGIKLAIGVAELENTDTVFIANRKFFPLNNKFVELIVHSKWDLYVEHKCDIIPPGKPAAYGGTSQTSASTSYSSISSGGRFYELHLPSDYEIKPYLYYWLKKNGELNRFVNMNQLMKLYKEKKTLFKAYVKKHHLKYSNQADIIQLINYLESN